MKTRALGPLWPLNLLDRLDISTTQLMTILILAGTVLGSLFGLFAYDRVPESYQPADDLGRWSGFAFPISATATNMAAIIYLARSSEQSLLKLIATDPALSDISLRPGSPIVFSSFLVPVPIYIYLLSFFAANYEMSLFEYFQRAISLDVVVWFNMFIAFPAWVSTTGYFVAIFIGQSFMLQQVAKRVDIDLANLQRLNPISEPFVRLVIFTAILLSLVQLGTIGVQDEGILDRFAALLSVLVILILGSLATLYIWPIWVLRTRIRDAKQSQLDHISSALKGNSSSLPHVIASSSSDDLSKGELLNRQMFVESRWEWPIASHVQQLVLFGLLPPLTWVLAAVVENILY